MNVLDLFSGAGGGILGSYLLGHRTICAVEINPYCRRVLSARQDDGTLPPFPVWDDICTFDGQPWRGRVDVVAGGFPCQDISIAGRGAGIDGAKSGLWREMARVIGEVRPRYVFVENSPALVGRGLGTVLGDLSEMGFNARWGVLGAHHAGAPHYRDRLWIVAHAHGQREPQPQRTEQEQRGRSKHGGQDVADAARLDRGGGARRPQGAEPHHGGSPIDARDPAGEGLPHRPAQPMGEPGAQPQPQRPDWWESEPDVGRVVAGLASRLDRIKALGNGQVPAVVKLAWEMISP